MSRVDRRPTVVRNFLAGDRRSVEWALEQWMSARPPVDHVTLSGDGASVAATALGLLDVMRLRGLAALPFGVTAEWMPDATAQPSPAHALACACGAGCTTWDALKPDDVLLCTLEDARHQDLADRILKLRQQVVVLVRPAQKLPITWRDARAQGRIHVVPDALASGGLSPVWEGILEDAAPARLVILGGGPGLFGATIAAGDFFLERMDRVPSGREALELAASRVAVLTDAVTAPAAWARAQDVWEDACRQAGAQVRQGLQAHATGVVMVPVQRMASAA